MNIRAIGITTAIFAGISLSAYAQDIEIYDGTIGDSGTTEIQPNVLFVLDSSGSMTGIIASSAGDFNYDPTEDYGNDGDATDDTYIYVHDNSTGAYTGVYFEPSQVACQSLLDTHAANPSNPTYTDQALQWQAEIVNVGGTETCTGSTEETETISASSISVTNGGSSYIMGPIDASDVVDGTDLDFFVDVPDRGRVDYILQYTSNGSNWYSSSCSGNAGGMDGGSASCSVPKNSVPLGVTDFRMRITESDNGPNTSTFDADFSYTKSDSTGCTTTGGTPTYVAEWNSDFEQSSESDWVLECASDAGVHGLTSSSTNNYLALCPDDACTSPNYTSTASAQYNWTSSGTAYYRFYSGNYHDFKLANPIPEGITTTEQDANSYCSSSTYGDWFTDDGVVYQCQRKWEVMEAAVKDITTSSQNIDIGLMRFFDRDASWDQGGSVTLAVDDIDATLASGKTQREAMIEAVENIDYETTTPLSETLYEAYLYFAGLNPLYNDSSIDDSNAYNSSGYISPASDNSCESNNIVYLTDGAPVSDGDADDEIEALIGSSCSGNCLDELAGYMANNDINGTMENDQKVNLYTVGFGIDLELLEDAATEGNGQYRNANNYKDLVDAFAGYLEQIALTAPATLVAPAVSVNAFNELQHRDQIYYAVFSPQASPRWNGNIKKYKLDNGVVLDRNASAAIDESTGFFDQNSTSYWSNVTDGYTVEIGGVREQLTSNRRVYVGGNSLETPQSGIVELSDSYALSQSLTGAASIEQAEKIRDWILGKDVLDEDEDTDFADANQFLGESLHSKPFVVTYSGTSEADAEDVLFFTTNTGFLHAVDARGGGSGDLTTGGTEMWSYIPADLIGNPKGYMDNAAGDDHVYGLDGEATVYTRESSTSSSTSFELETVKIYQGMRRGGTNYYAWDVSNALGSGVPITEDWVISGGSGDFADLGQTWSQMIRTELSYGCDSDGDGCTTTDVLVFSGGYDSDAAEPYYDNPEAQPLTSASPTIEGNSLYIVNAETGDLIWSVGGDAGHDLSLPMYNSIPATPSPIDIDGDGDMDILFAIDIAGEVWRIDFDEEATNIADLAQGGLIADLGESATPATDGFLRFYNSLDVSLTIPTGEYPYFNLAVGSGYRAHPKDTSEPTNRLFVIYDDYVLEPKDDNNDGNYEYTYNGGDIISFTGGDLIAASYSSPAEKGVNTDHGFYLTLPESDEKILNQTLTFNGRVVITSYVPDDGSSATGDPECGGVGSTGGGNVYVIDLATGQEIYNAELNIPGIPPEVATILTDDGLTVCVGTECQTARDDFNFNDETATPENVPEALGFDPGTALRTYWREQ